MTIETTEHTLRRYVSLWVRENYPERLRSIEAYLTNADEQKIGKMPVNDYVIVRYKNRRILISTTKEKNEHASTEEALYSRKYVISGLFAKKQIDTLLEEILALGLKRDEEARKVYSKPKRLAYDNWGPKFVERAEVQGKKLEHLFLSKENKEKLIKDLEWFKSSKEHFTKKHLSYKRGYTFSGEPGNGKSSLAYAIAEYLGYNLAHIEIDEHKSLVSVMKVLPPRTVVVFEDFDNYYHLREAQGETKTNFSSVLNALSGTGNLQEVVTVITTNKRELLDPALLRAGRTDLEIQLKNPTKEEVEVFASHFFDTPIVIDEFKETCYANIQDILITSKTPEEFLNKYKTW